MASWKDLPDVETVPQSDSGSVASWKDLPDVAPDAEPLLDLHGRNMSQAPSHEYFRPQAPNAFDASLEQQARERRATELIGQQQMKVNAAKAQALAEARSRELQQYRFQQLGGVQRTPQIQGPAPVSATQGVAQGFASGAFDASPLGMSGMSLPQFAAQASRVGPRPQAMAPPDASAGPMEQAAAERLSKPDPLANPMAASMQKQFAAVEQGAPIAHAAGYVGGMLASGMIDPATAAMAGESAFKAPLLMDVEKRALMTQERAAMVERASMLKETAGDLSKQGELFRAGETHNMKVTSGLPGSPERKFSLEGKSVVFGDKTQPLSPERAASKRQAEVKAMQRVWVKAGPPVNEEYLNDLSKEAFQHMQRQVSKVAETAPTEGLPKSKLFSGVEEPKTIPEDFRPSMGMVHRTEDGRNAITLFEFKADNMEAPRGVTIPVNSADDVAKVRAQLSKRGGNIAFSSTAADVFPDPAAFHAMYADPSVYKVAGPELKAYKPGMEAPEDLMEAQRLDKMLKAFNEIRFSPDQYVVINGERFTPVEGTLAKKNQLFGTTIRVRDAAGNYSEHPFTKIESWGDTRMSMPDKFDMGVSADGHVKFQQASRGEMLGEGHMQMAPPPAHGESNIRIPQQLEMSAISDSVIADQQMLQRITQNAGIQQLMREAHASGKPSILDRFLDGALDDMYRGPTALREHLTQIQAAPLKNRPDEIERAFKARLPKGNMLSDTAFEYGKLARGEISAEKFAANIQKELGPAAAQEFVRFGQSVKSEIADHHAWFRSRNLFAPTEGLTESQVNAYVGRFYYTHMLPQGKWADLVLNAPKGSAPHAALTDMVDEVMKEAAKSGEDINPNAVATDLLDILRSSDPIAALRGGGKETGGSKAWDRFKARKELSPVMRRFLGEEQNGVVSTAYTLAHQRQLRASITAWDDFVDGAITGKHAGYSPTPVPGWLKVPDQEALFGKAAGGYIDPRMRSALSVPAHYNGGFTLMNRLVSNVKYAQVAGSSPAAHISNAVRNIWGGYLSGLFTPQNLVGEDMAAVTAMRQAFKELNAYHHDPVSGSALVQEARKYGALSAPYGQMELATGQYQNQLMDYLHRNMSERSGIMDIYNHVADFNKSWKGKISGAYDMVDQVFKMSTYIKVKDGFIKEGMSAQDAARKAARRINESYPNFAHVGTAVDKLRKTPFGTIAPYLSGHTEEIRIMGMIPQRFKEDPEFMTGQMIGAAATLAGAAAALQTARELSGITQDEIDQITAESRKSGQVYTPAKVYLPIRDANGAPIPMDLSKWWMPLQMMQGHPDDAAYVKIPANLLLQTLGPGAQDMVRGSLERGGILRPVKPDQRVMESQSNIANMATAAWKFGLLGPTFPYKVADAAQKSGMIDMRPRGAMLQEPLTPGVAASQLFLPVTPPHKAGGVEAAQSAREFINSPQFGIRGNMGAMQSLGKMEFSQDKEKNRQLIQQYMKEEAGSVREKAALFAKTREAANQAAARRKEKEDAEKNK